MPRFSQDQKDAARRNETWATNTGHAALALAAVTQVVPVAGIPAGPLLALVGAVALWRAKSQDRIAADPPRDDYYAETTLEPAWMSTEHFGDSEIQAAGAAFARVTDDLARLFEAVVVAVERAEGAERAGDFASMQVRTAEALAFAKSAADQLRWSSRYAAALAQAVRDSGSSEGSELVNALEETANADATYRAEIEQALGNGSFLEGPPEDMGMGTGAEALPEQT
jgi:hypothetical protein